MRNWAKFSDRSRRHRRPRQQNVGPDPWWSSRGFPWTGTPSSAGFQLACGYWPAHTGESTTLKIIMLPWEWGRSMIKSRARWDWDHWGTGRGWRKPCKFMGVHFEMGTDGTFQDILFHNLLPAWPPVPAAQGCDSHPGVSDTKRRGVDFQHKGQQWIGLPQHWHQAEEAPSAVHCNHSTEEQREVVMELKLQEICLLKFANLRNH